MAVRIIDLSVPTEPSQSEPQTMEVTHEQHEAGAATMMVRFGCDREDLPH